MRTRDVLEDDSPPNLALAGTNELARVTELRGLIAGLAVTDLTLLPDPVVRDNVLAMVSISNQVNAVLWAQLAVFDARGLSGLDGFKQTKQWLMAFGRLTPHTAGDELNRATALRGLPALAAACERGEVCADEVDQVVKLVKDVGLANVKDSDEYLAGLASVATAKEVKTACDRIRAHLDPDGPEPDPGKDWEKRDLSISRSGNHVIVKGRLDLESGAALMTALDAQLRPPGPDDLRSPGQRRADAFAEIIASVLNHGCLPSVRGRRPSVGVLVRPSALLRPPVVPLTHEEKVAAFLRQYGEDLHRDQLGGCASNQPTTDTAAPNAGAHGDGVCVNGGAGGVSGVGCGVGAEHGGAHRSGDRDDHAPGGPAGSPSGGEAARPIDSGLDRSTWDPVTDAGFPPLPEGGWMDWVGEVPIETVRRLACDCSVWRVLLDPLSGLPLDVGRERRVAPEWMLRALHARDRTCRWPGCDAPSMWTDAHHTDEWYRDGGETNVDKLVSLCRPHHVAVHEGRWRVTLDAGTGEVRVFRPDGRPYELGPTQAWTAATAHRSR